MLSGRYGQYNQAGDLAPKTGAQSELIRKNLGQLFISAPPIVGQFFFHDYIGSTEIPGVQDGVITMKPGYNGSLPAVTQPTIVRALPWDISHQVEGES